MSALRRVARAGLTGAALMVAPGPLAAQQVGVALEPDSITVGDVTRLGVRVLLPAGARVALPDSLPIDGDLENSGRRDLTTEDRPDGGRVVTAMYPLTAWRPGVDSLPPIAVIYEADGRTWTDTVALPVLVVVSVLPADTAGLEAQPPKDVLGPSWVWWLWALLALAVALAIGLLVWWLRRRQAAPPAVSAPAVPPRERALAALDAIRAEALHERPSIEPFYERVSGVVREYLAEIDARWSRDRTTAELAAAVLPAGTPETAARLRTLLRDADGVKFAAVRPDAATALRHLDQVRAWVEGFPPRRATLDDEPERAA